MTKNTYNLQGEKEANLELLYSSGFNEDDYNLIVSKLPDSIVMKVTEIRKGELYIILQNRTSQLVVQLIGTPEDYRIGKSSLTKVNK